MRPDEAPARFRVRDAALSYRGRPALDGVDLALGGGEILALLGPNGAGKTSLMRLVAGRLVPGRGSVRVEGRDPAGDRAARRLIGWVPQEIALYPRLTVAENLDVFARLAGLARADRREAVARVIDQTATGAVARAIVGTLSGGYQRRVNIAASLVAAPRLILLDEPTQGVDLDARAAIHAVLTRLRAEGAGILLSTHDFAEAERLADRVAFIARGRIVREGRLAALMRPLAGATPTYEAVLDAAPEPDAAAVLRRAGLGPVDGDERATAWRVEAGGADRVDAAALMRRLREEGAPVAEIRIRRPGLETLYRAAIGGTGPAVPTHAPLAEAVT